MSFISYIAVDWGKSNPILPQRPILMTKTEAFKLGIIDEKGKRSKIPGTNKATSLATIKEKNAFTDFQ